MIMLTAGLIRNAVERAGFKWFWQSNPARAFDLNLVAVRTENREAGKFDDWLTLTYFDLKGDIRFYRFPVTCDPGDYYLEHPEQKKGTAVIARGQYRNCYKKGLHKGKPALVQCAPIAVYRDSNLDRFADIGGKIEVGMFGTNIHGSVTRGCAVNVGKWSAGCIVFQCAEDLELFLFLVNQAFAITDDGTVSLTMLHESDFAFLQKAA